MQESERELIRQIVREELAHRGLDAANADHDRDTIRWLREHRAAFQSAGNIGWRGFVLAVVTGLTVAVWEGLKVLIAKASP